MQSPLIREAGQSQHRCGAYAGRQGHLSAEQQGQPNQKYRKSWPPRWSFTILPEEKLQALLANGIASHRGTLDCQYSTPDFWQSMDGSSLNSWAKIAVVELRI
jgi:hypothetical protein